MQKNSQWWEVAVSGCKTVCRRNHILMMHWCKTILHYLINEAHISSRAVCSDAQRSCKEAGSIALHCIALTGNYFHNLISWIPSWCLQFAEPLMPNYFQNLTKWLEAHNARDPLMQNYRLLNLPRKPRTKKPVAVVVACVCVLQARFLLCIYYEIIISYYDCASGG